MAEEIIKARVWTKIDTLDAWDANPLILGRGEFAPVLTAVGGFVFNFKVGTGDRRFSDLPWSLQTPGAAIAADTNTVFPTDVPGLYIPTEDGTYDGVSVDLSDGYNQLIWDGSTLTKVVFPIDLSGYQPQTLLSLHTQWANEWFSAAPGRNYVFDADGYLSSGEIRWPDGQFGLIDNITMNEIGYLTIRLNRPTGESKAIQFTYEYTNGVISRVYTQPQGY